MTIGSNDYQRACQYANKLAEYRKIIKCLLSSLSTNRHRELRVNQPLWVKVTELCGLGSTSAHELCRDFGLDPYTKR